MGEIGEAFRPEVPSSSMPGFVEPDPAWPSTGLLLPPPGLILPAFHAVPRIQAMLHVGAPDTFDMSPLSGGIYDQNGWPRCAGYSFAAIKSYEERIEHSAWYSFDPDTLFKEGGGSDQSGGVMEYMCDAAQQKGVIRRDTGNRYKILSYARARQDPQGFVEDVKAAIAAQKPVQLALLLPSSFGWSSSGANTTGYHAVCAIGYDPTWCIIQNSWGPNFGQRGFGRVPWSFLTQQNFQNGYCYALVVTDELGEYIEPGPSPTPPPVPPTPTPTPTDEIEQLFAAVNAFRTQNSVGALVNDAHLNQSSQGYAQVLSTNSGFSHTGPDGSTPQSRGVAAGYNGLVGENIARTFSDVNSVMVAWENSPGHRANLLDARYNDIGLGIATGSQGKAWVQDFGIRTGPSPTPPPPPPPPPTPVPPPTPPTYKKSVVLPQDQNTAVTQGPSGGPVIIQGGGFGTTVGKVRLGTLYARVLGWVDAGMAVLLPSVIISTTTPITVVMPNGTEIVSPFNFTITTGITPIPSPLSVTDYSGVQTNVSIKAASPFSIRGTGLDAVDLLVSHGGVSLQIITKTAASVNVIAEGVGGPLLAPIVVSSGGKSVSGPPLLVLP